MQPLVTSLRRAVGLVSEPRVVSSSSVGAGGTGASAQPGTEGDREQLRKERERELAWLQAQGPDALLSPAEFDALEVLPVRVAERGVQTDWGPRDFAVNTPTWLMHKFDAGEAEEAEMLSVLKQQGGRTNMYLVNK